jgi:ribonuclease P protein component
VVPRFTFKKEERLTSQKTIAALMQQGTFLRSGSIKIIWLQTALTVAMPIQVCIAVPKRRIPKATDRIAIKRKMRNAYRLSKAAIYSFLKERNHQLAIMVIYLGNNKANYSNIESDLNKGLTKLIDTLETSS